MPPHIHNDVLRWHALRKVKTELKHIPSKRPQAQKSNLPAGNCHAGILDTRVSKLEEFAGDARERLSCIETRLDTCATKSDLKDLESTMHREFSSMHKEFSNMHKEFSNLHKEFSSMRKELHGLTWKLIGATGMLVSIVYFIATQVKP